MKDDSFLRAKLFATILLSVPQIYIVSIGDAYLSIGALVASSILFTDLKKFRFALKSQCITILIFLACYQLISLAWSDNYKYGFKIISILIIFIATYLGTYNIAISNIYSLVMAMRYYSYFLFLVSLSTIGFRVFPNLEDAYFHSELAKILIGPSFIDGLLMGDTLNNILDPDKSAGLFFANANVAGIYLGISTIAMFWFSAVLSSRLCKASALLAFFAIFFAGSKSAILLVLVVVFLGLFFAQKYSKGVAKPILFFALLSSIYISVVLFFLIGDSFEGFLSETRDTSMIRLWIWDYAAEEFVKSPVLGQGFGGWQAGFARYADERNEGFPPHNTFIYLWSQSGIIAVILAILFMISVLISAFKLIKIGKKHDYFLGVTLLMVSLWIFIHGMGENGGLVGEAHQEILFAVLLAMVNARIFLYRKQQMADSISPNQIGLPFVTNSVSKA